MKIIHCKCGYHILVDDENYDSLSLHNWNCNGTSVSAEIDGKTVNMGRLIIYVPKGLEPDHIDRDYHNNLKSNLRVATKAQNTANRKTRCDSSHGFKCVKFDGRKAKPWYGRIMKNGKFYRTDYFATVELAAHAVDKLNLEINGEFAFLNFQTQNSV